MPAASRILLGVVLLAAGALLPASAKSAAASHDSEHILVTFNALSPPLQRRAGSGFKGYSSAAYASRATARYLTKQLAADYSLQVIDNWPMDVLDVHCVLYRVLEAGEAGRIIAALRLDSRVESVQQMRYFYLQSAKPAYNDPYHELQRGWWDASLSAAHRLSTGKNVKVGIVDTAVERRHRDLQAALADVQRFVPDGRGSEGDYHGTSVAGIIGAEAGNGVGIVGVAPGTRLFSLEACWSTSHAQAQCDSFTLAKALSWAIRQDLDVINLSLAGPEDPLLGRLIEAALQRGISIIAADGGRDGLSFPASFPGVIAVRAVENSNYDASARGQEDVIYAPGRDVMTTVPGGSYDFVSGSSMAAAHVSGLVALVRAYDTSLSGFRINELLRQTSAQNRRDATTTYTSIDACTLLLATASKRHINCTPPVLVAR